jgi:AcrR family transcriptional regulator
MPKRLSNSKAAPKLEIRENLSRKRIVKAAVAIADRDGIDSLSMRKLGLELDVKAMSLYNYIANKEELLDAMCDFIVSLFEKPKKNVEWKESVRRSSLSAHKVLWKHPWACSLSMSRPNIGSESIVYAETMMGVFRRAGFSPQLTHHAMHAVDNHVYGSTLQEIGFKDGLQSFGPEIAAIYMQQMVDKFPYASEIIREATHDHQIEFEFVLDLLLDGLERVRDKSAVKL